MSGALLQLDQVSRLFGGLVAVDKLSFDLFEGDILSIIGPNGAGKTTAFNLISNIFPPSDGEIRFQGQVINGLPMHKIADGGIARTFQNLRIFPNLSVRENVLVGLARTNKTSIMSTILRLRSHRHEERRLAADADKLLELMELADVADQMARNLPYGSQRRVEIARALATDPQIVMLDEPAAGMNPAEIAELMILIRRLRDALNKTILLVEHHMSLVMDVSDRIVVMDQGKKIVEGQPQEIRNDPRVIEAYLGSVPV